MATSIYKTDLALKRNLAATRRAEAGQQRTDARGWVVQRRERTRHLIELGGLIQKAGLVELTNDDRATLYGALLDLTGRVRDGDPENVLALWKRRGRRAFDAESEAEKDRPMKLDIEAIRAEVRAIDYVRGTPAEVAMWREDDEDSRANLEIEDMALEPDENALFDMLRDEGVPPSLATQILLRLLDHPDADRSLPITPMAAR